VTAAPRLVIGCMTGTSIDALDVALVRIHGRGLDMRAEVLATHTRDLGPLAPDLRELADQVPTPAARVAEIARDLALLHAAAVEDLLDRAPSPSPRDPVDLICVHGQTIAHRPPVSWQLFNPWPLVHAARAPVVFDLRGADLAAGGQGAPITPVADWILYRADRPRAIVNLGGFCNITLLPGHNRSASPDAIRAGDVCVCNQLLDTIARRRLGIDYDDGGAVALRGRRVEPLVGAIIVALRSQAAAGRSLGTGDELAALPGVLDPAVAAEDAAHSACCAIGEVIADACSRAGELVLAGGGVRNAALVAALRAAAELRGRAVVTSDDAGIPASHREAIAFAILGALCEDRVPITLPGVTGVTDPAPIAGCWVRP
jgi:1,6-anhydro-N-acetylmuramate kinase